MQRGDVYLVDLDPAQGSESRKVRPAIVVSNSAANRAAERHHRGVVTIVPVTSSTDRIYPFQVLIPAGEGGLGRAWGHRLTERGQVRPEVVRMHEEACRSLGIDLPAAEGH